MLDETVRAVELRPSFSNPKIIPPSVIRRKDETLEDHLKRKSHSSGFVVMEPTTNCSIPALAEEFEAAGYEMVDAFLQKRFDPENKFKIWYVVRFLFVRREYATPSEEFLAKRSAIRADLDEMMQSVLWRVRALLNPAYINGIPIEGQQMLSINLEARKPLFNPDGTPVTVWQKDEKGERVGNAPIPLQAEHYFHL